MVHLCHGCDGRLAPTAGDSLFDGNARRKSVHQIDVRLFELLHELARVGRHAVEEAALAFREQDIECERGFTGSAESGNHDHLIARNGNIDVLEIVLASAMDSDRAVRRPPVARWTFGRSKQLRFSRVMSIRRLRNTIPPSTSSWQDAEWCALRAATRQDIAEKP